MSIKRTINDLAIFGGGISFPEALFVGRPNIGDRNVLQKRIQDLLDRKWLTNDGPLVKEFEQRIASYTGVKHCIVMCNATIALEVAIRALNLTGEVIIPSFTFIATAHALQWQGITPVFCDIDPETHNIDPQRIELMITPRTTGIIGVHVWGRACDVDSLATISERHGLRLLFDAAHAFGCSYKQQMIGGFGDAEVFSFHATKFFNTFEGGAVLTNNDDLANKIRLMRNFGFAGYDKVVYIGTNGKMSEVSAAMGLTSLESLVEFLDVNKRYYEAYRERLKEIPGISIISYDPSEKCNYQYVVLEVDEKETGIGRDQIVKILWAENVIARRYFYPGCHLMEPYRSYFPHAGLLLPVTERLTERILLLPTGTSVSETAVDLICSILRLIIMNRTDIVRRLENTRVLSETR